mmetsp:Transcript_39610/g.29248  ORF Transcript_39610/g.29248 Transcript_39610/m.29248 type:complete len:141 (-) Transcript_39610:591-1013(-)
MFLDGSARVPKVFIASLMRSGNSMFRKLFEQTSGVVTGTNNRNVSSPQIELICQGFKGEDIIDDQIWFVKTHFPYNYPHLFRPHKGSAAVVIVRNPIDVTVSLLNFLVTNTHSQNIQNDFPKEFPKEWDHIVKLLTRVWK